MATGQPYIEPAVAAPVAQPHVETDPHAAPPKIDEKHVEAAHGDGIVNGIDADGMIVDGAHTTSGLAVIEQLQAIPRTGKRIPTGRWEYITFCLYCEWRPSGMRGGADCL